MPDSAGDKLRELLRQQAEAAAADEVARAAEGLPSDRIERLQRLQKVAEAYEATHPRPPRRRWPVAAVFLATLVGCSVLLFVRRRETDILLDVSVSEAAFVLPTTQKLTELMPLASLGASGLSEVALPRAKNQGARTLQSADGPVPPIRLAVAGDARQQGSITLESLILPANSRVRVGLSGERAIQLSLERAEVEVRASVYGPIESAIAGEGVQRLDVASPQPVGLRSTATETQLDLGLAGAAKSAFSVPIRADSLLLVQVDRAGDEAHTMIRRTSAIQSGSLYFESLNGLERKLRPGEILDLSGARGEFTVLGVEPDHLALRYQGRVNGLTVGTGETQRSLMPTWLEWLKARRGAWLLWGTAVYLFGLVMGFLRWLGKI